jgi:hypothetical protein
MARRRRDRPRTDDTNWSVRDNVEWYTEQAKSAVGAAGEVARMPRAWIGGVREMVRDMRESESRPSDDENRPK